LPQDVAGLSERDQRAQQGDHGSQGGAPVAVQAPLVVGGAVAAMTVAAVVVGPLVGQGAIDREDVMGAILDVTGIGLAVGADGAGAYVPPFFRSCRPAC
jgi:hypothetical protein